MLFRLIIPPSHVFRRSCRYERAFALIEECVCGEELRAGPLFVTKRTNDEGHTPLLLTDWDWYLFKLGCYAPANRPVAPQSVEPGFARKRCDVVSAFCRNGGCAAIEDNALVSCPCVKLSKKRTPKIYVSVLKMALRERVYSRAERSLLLKVGNFVSCLRDVK